MFFSDNPMIVSSHKKIRKANEIQKIGQIVMICCGKMLHCDEFYRRLSAVGCAKVPVIREFAGLAQFLHMKITY